MFCGKCGCEIDADSMFVSVAALRQITATLQIKIKPVGILNKYKAMETEFSLTYFFFRRAQKSLFRLMQKDSLNWNLKIIKKKEVKNYVL